MLLKDNNNSKRFFIHGSGGLTTSIGKIATAGFFYERKDNNRRE